MVEEDSKKTSKPKEKYILKEIVTQTDVAIGTSDNEEQVFSDKELLLEILNKLDRIEKAIA